MRDCIFPLCFAISFCIGCKPKEKAIHGPVRMEKVIEGANELLKRRAFDKALSYLDSGYRNSPGLVGKDYFENSLEIIQKVATCFSSKWPHSFGLN